MNKNFEVKVGSLLRLDSAENKQHFLELCRVNNTIVYTELYLKTLQEEKTLRCFAIPIMDELNNTVAMRLFGSVGICNDMIHRIKRCNKNITFITYDYQLLNEDVLGELGSENPRIWDIVTGEKVLTMGIYSSRYFTPKTKDKQAEISEAIRESFNAKYKINMNPYRHNYRAIPTIETDMLAWNHLREMVKRMYRLYAKQCEVAKADGSYKAIIEIEMPYIWVNLGINRRGVKISPARCIQFIGELKQEAEKEEGELKTEDITPEYALQWVRGREDGKQLNRLDPKIEELMESYNRNMINLGTLQELVRLAKKSEYNIVYPKHVHLGASTGRNTCVSPCITTIKRKYRSVVVARNDCAIFEMDYSQEEPGLAGAIFRCPGLIDNYNNGEVYVPIAKDVFRDELPAEAMKMDWREFQKGYPAKRDKAKTIFLSILYQMNVGELARRLGISVEKADALIKRFFSCYPGLEEQIMEAIRDSVRRGYSVCRFGIRRYRGSQSIGNFNESNWMMNFMVQGAGACIFKKAAVRMKPILERYGAYIIIPNHDSYIIECPGKNQAIVKGYVERVMKWAIMDSFPELKPRVSITDNDTSCWNKE